MKEALPPNSNLSYFETTPCLFHQFIKRDKSDQIVLNIDTLAALAAALVRRSYIDCLDQLMCGSLSKITCPKQVMI